jgi:hypothetical protein
LESEYRHVASDGRRYKETDLTAAKPGGDTEFEWRVKRPLRGGVRWEADLADEYRCPQPGWEYRGVGPYRGRYWAYSKANLREFACTGKLIHRETGMPRLMQFADEMPGVSLQDNWDDISPASGAEDLGWPTQKPSALLERVVAASSNPGDVVLDPFCGCGTAIVAAHKLSRRWVGIDITTLAIAVMRSRLRDCFGAKMLDGVLVEGLPQDVAGAHFLAGSQENGRKNRKDFELWALGLVGARPLGGIPKQGADRGIDGVITFAGRNGKLGTVIVSVKSGDRITSKDVRELKGTVEREKAAMGMFVTLREPTREMRREAEVSGHYHSDLWNRDYPKIQILTIRELLEDGKKPDVPSYALPAYPVASRVPVAVGVQQQTYLDEAGQPIDPVIDDESPMDRKPEDSAESDLRGSQRPGVRRKSASAG